MHSWQFGLKGRGWVSPGCLHRLHHTHTHTPHTHTQPLPFFSTHAVQWSLSQASGVPATTLSFFFCVPVPFLCSSNKEKFLFMFLPNAVTDIVNTFPPHARASTWQKTCCLLIIRDLRWELSQGVMSGWVKLVKKEVLTVYKGWWHSSETDSICRNLLYRWADSMLPPTDREPVKLSRAKRQRDNTEDSLEREREFKNHLRWSETLFSDLYLLPMSSALLQQL